MMATDMLFTLLNSSSVRGKIPPEMDSSVYDDFNLEILDTELTSTETDNISIHLTLLKLFSMLTRKQSTDGDATSDNIDGLVSHIQLWMTHKLSTLSSLDYISK